jgi:hypothetical protein
MDVHPGQSVVRPRGVSENPLVKVADHDAQGG